MRKLARNLLNPRWIVDDDGDPGIAIGPGPFRVIVGYYKWPDVFTVRRASRVSFRDAKKRELNTKDTQCAHMA